MRKIFLLTAILLASLLAACTKGGAAPQREEAERLVMTRDTPALEQLIQGGLDANTELDEAGTTLMHKAAMMTNKEMMEMLIRRGANVNAQDKHGRTPLLIVENVLQTDITDMLLKNKADATLADRQGKNALHYVLRVEGMLVLENKGKGRDAKKFAESEEIVRKNLAMLLERGANPEVKDSTGKSPADMAKENGVEETIKLIGQRRGAAQDQPTSATMTAGAPSAGK